MSSAKQTIVATARDMVPELARLEMHGHLSTPEAVLVKLFFEQRDADAEETGRLTLPTCLEAP